MEVNPENQLTRLNDSQGNNLREAIRTYKYPLTPKKNNNLRNEKYMNVITHHVVKYF